MSGEAVICSSCLVKKEVIEGKPLHDIVKMLTEYAPLSLAESWDNVGLLIEPFTKRDVKRIMLTNDLAAPVMEECIGKEVDMIISYHPPIFSPLKKLCLKTWTDKVIQCCLENKIAVYSPHTTWDSVPGGISDWLASAFDVEESRALQPYYAYTPIDLVYSVVVVVTCVQENLDLFPELGKIGLKNLRNGVESGNSQEVTGSCTKEDLPRVCEFLKSNRDISFEVFNRAPIPDSETGVGRFVTFTEPISIKEAMERVKNHTKVKYCRIAYALNSGPDTLISTAAVVPGSGGKVLMNVKADLYVTGEMLHHDVLAAIHNNSSVITTTHSDSERGFLKEFAEYFQKKLDNKVEVLISEKDKDPIQLY